MTSSWNGFGEDPGPLIHGRLPPLNPINKNEQEAEGDNNAINTKVTWLDGSTMSPC